MKALLICGCVAGIALMSGCAGTRDYGGTDYSGQSAVTTGAQTGVASSLPAAVENTVKEKAPGGTIAGVVRQNRNGRTIYEVVFSDPIRYPKLWIAEDGTFLSDKENYLP
ncbi:MAG TPA: hypothetical protein VFM25_04870 [Verrucomicrobiae bacterium]|nr:hypothetical protein [Verrucomicrobiae bacterium]